MWRLGFVTLCACGSFGADVPPGNGDASADDAAPEVDADTRYRATPVRFERAGEDHIWTGLLANTSGSTRGTYSGWFRFTGASDGTMQMLAVAQVIGIGGVFRTANNRFRFVFPSCNGGIQLDMESRGMYTVASGWVHVLASWDLVEGRAQLYVNDKEDRAPNPTINTDNICYDALRWGIGGLSQGQLDADVADLYADLGSFIDLGLGVNRRRFRDDVGNPIDLGERCDGPTGTQPTGCFKGDLATWHTNKGVGAGFNLEGNGLTLAPDGPSTY
jgi:hypothetical protein